MTSWWHSSCWICFKRERGTPVICSDCLAGLKRIVLEYACSKCKAPLLSAQVCGECLQTHWDFEQLHTPFYYNAMAKYVLHHLKFYQHLLLLPQLSALLIAHLQDYFRENPPQVIVPVPLHRWRMLKRGFNQAHELAKRVGRAYDIPVNAHLAYKVKHTQAQARLHVDERHKNLKASFRVRVSEPLAHVLIVDDVFTTGATVNALAREFKKAGVNKVDVLTLFRAY